MAKVWEMDNPASRTLGIVYTKFMHTSTNACLLAFSTLALESPIIFSFVSVPKSEASVL